jgi:hypothetical protein
MLERPFRVLRCFTEAEVLPICLLQDEVRRDMCVRVQPDHQRVLNISNRPRINRLRTCSVAADIGMSSIPVIDDAERHSDEIGWLRGGRSRELDCRLVSCMID